MQDQKARLRPSNTQQHPSNNLHLPSRKNRGLRLQQIKFASIRDEPFNTMVVLKVSIGLIQARLPLQPTEDISYP